jgi:ABC-type sugar transport system ATPase subunit
MAAITLERVSRIFPGGHAGIQDVSLEIRDGELVVLVGPSGSGKSTLLRLIAGLEPPSSGRILIDGRDVTDVPPQQRDLAMVFQSYALYPHKTVRENLGFGLRMRKVPAGDISTRVQRVAASLQIEKLLDRRPSQLSGGQRQRVALGRAIVREPRRPFCSTNRSRISIRGCGSTRGPRSRFSIAGSAPPWCTSRTTRRRP